MAGDPQRAHRPDQRPGPGESNPGNPGDAFDVQVRHRRNPDGARRRLRRAVQRRMTRLSWRATNARSRGCSDPHAARVAGADQWQTAERVGAPPLPLPEIPVAHYFRCYARYRSIGESTRVTIGRRASRECHSREAESERAASFAIIGVEPTLRRETPQCCNWSPTRPLLVTRHRRIPRGRARVARALVRPPYRLHPHTDNRGMMTRTRSTATLDSRVALRLWHGGCTGCLTGFGRGL